MNRLSIDFVGTFDLAQWCKLLRDRGFTGHQVAQSLGRSEGYVNNLIRILERASLEVLARWKIEQARPGVHVPICATDWLMHVCVMPHADQNAELARRIERYEGKRAETAAVLAPDATPAHPARETSAQRAPETTTPAKR